MTTSTVNYSTFLASIPAFYQRATFYAAGRFWIFYGTSSTEFWYISSSDGINWTNKTSTPYRVIHWDGTYVHTFRDNYYRRGIPQSDGTIDWEDEKYTGNPDDLGTLTLDSEGYPVLAYSEYISGVGRRVKVRRATSKDGTSWEDPVQLDTVSSYHIGILPLTNRKLYAIWHAVNAFYGSFFDGTSWSDPIKVGTRAGNVAGHSEVSVGDTVYFVHQAFNKKMYFRYWTESSGWSDPELIEDTYYSDTSVPTISKEGSRNLYVIWYYSTYICYRKRKNLTTWEDTVLWLSGESPSSVDYNSTYEANLDKISFVFMNDDTYPYPIRHDWLPGIPLWLSEILALSPSVLLRNDTFAQAYKLVVRLSPVGTILVKLKERIV